MAGHSKWANIKHRKGRQDAARGKLFAKLAKGIEAAARAGGGDPEMNAALNTAVAKAKASSMPNDNIERAIKRGTGESDDAVVYDEFFYEGYGPGGVAVLVKVLTDNRNRTSSDVRVAFTRNGGNLGEPGSVAYLFEQKGYFLVSGEEDEVMMVALEAGAEDVKDAGDGKFEIITAPTDFGAVKSALDAAGLEPEEADVTQMPDVSVPVDADTAPKVLRLIDALEDVDDIQDVYANFDISDEIMESLDA
jgi:YebC/PmpR family DNA-binding regulatory protein